jgi:transcriptional regulator with XRE-family HTH domain
MTAILLTPDQRERTLELSRAIGQTIRDARDRAGETSYEAAAAIGGHQTRVCDIERGVSPNPKLGSLVKLLDRYGLELVVVPKSLKSIVDRLVEYSDVDTMRTALERAGVHE